MGTRRFLSCTSGASAIEFALVAPVLMGLMLVMVDLGMAVGEKMAIDQLLRAGAQLAMADPGTGPVLTALASMNEDAPGRSFAVTLRCPCSTGTCTTSCAPGALHNAYRLEVSSTYDSLMTGFSLPLSSVLEVRVR
ncbi:TadE/TadG family type IV pilus assembly protein [Halodurantibacterium flavum]|uniref:TadE/TadG family type IV pilus assembly protein n=1 Tax=Halodurantibacterium flavum TaxID=1382802 RepID=A0ABW4S6F1_9RHOB